MVTRSVRTLMSGLIDYAGLYPPAKLPMDQAVDNYAQYLRSPHAWMLGRFVCPVSRLEEFRREASRVLPKVGPPPDPAGAAPVGEHTGQSANGSSTGRPGAPISMTHPLAPPRAGVDPWDEPWRLSAIIDGDLDENLDAIFAFNHEHEQPRNGLANIDAIEIKAGNAASIDSQLEIVPEEVFPFFEVPLTQGMSGEDARGFIAALAGSDAGAKIRTGGVLPEAIPTCESVIAFLVGACAADIPFKATAGLHHAVRAEHPLSYEKGCPRAVMHGFLNLFMAAALVRASRCDGGDALDALRETDPTRFRFTDESAAWRNRQVGTDELAETRDLFALSFGACSFTEPVEELRALGLIDR